MAEFWNSGDPDRDAWQRSTFLDAAHKSGIQADWVSPSRRLLHAGPAAVYIVLQLAWMAGLALLLSVLTDAPLGAVGGAVLAAILSQILDQITALGTLRNYLPTHYSYAWSDLIASDVDWTNMAAGILSAVIYGTIFTLLAARHFARKDITS